MLKAFFDESGIRSHNPMLAVGCVVMRPERVRSLSLWWRRTLRDAGVREFKAADCTEGFNEFAAWSQSARDAFRTKLAAKIDQAAVYAMAISVDRKDFEKVVYPFAAVGSDFRDLYLWAMRACLEGVAKSPYRKNHRLACVFDEGYARWPQAHDHFKNVRRVQQLEHVFFEHFTVASSIDVPCLQAADLIAYELRHWSERDLGVPKRFAHLNDAFQKLDVGCGVLRADGLRGIINGVLEQLGAEARATWNAWRECCAEPVTKG